MDSQSTKKLAKEFAQIFAKELDNHSYNNTDNETKASAIGKFLIEFAGAILLFVILPLAYAFAGWCAGWVTEWLFFDSKGILNILTQLGIKDVSLAQIAACLGFFIGLLKT